MVLLNEVASKGFCFVLFWIFSISKLRGVLTMLKFHMWRRSVSYFGIWTRKLANRYIISAYAEVTSPAAGRDAHLHSKFHLSKSLSPQSQDWYYNYFPPKTLERHNPLNEESHFDSDLKQHPALQKPFRASAAKHFRKVSYVLNSILVQECLLCAFA